jgi:hypothetical protein
MFFSTAHFFQTISASRTNGTFGFADTQANASQNEKSHFLPMRLGKHN